LDLERGIDLVVRDIKKGDEAIYDYRVFANKGFSLKYLDIYCLCGEDNCCKIIKNQYPIPKLLKIFWKNKIDDALKMTDLVRQPLKAYILNGSWKKENFL